MATIKKSITIDVEIYKKIKKHNEDQGSTTTSVIRMALKKFFGIKKKWNEKYLND